MNHKKMMLVTLVLLAVLTMGAVSASDNATSDELAVDDGGVDVQLPQEDFDDVSTNENPDIIAVDEENNDVLGDGEYCTVNVVWNMMSPNGPVTSSPYSSMLSQGMSWTIGEAKFDNVIANYRQFDYEGNHYVFDHWENENGNTITGNQVLDWADEDYTVNYNAIYDITPIYEDCEVTVNWRDMGEYGENSFEQPYTLSHGEYVIIDQAKFDSIIYPYRTYDNDEYRYVFGHWEDDNGVIISGNQRIEWADGDYTVNYYAVYDAYRDCDVDVLWDMESENGGASHTQSYTIKYGDTLNISQSMFDDVIAPYQEFDYNGQHNVFLFWMDSHAEHISGDQILSWADGDYDVVFIAVYDVYYNDCNVNVIWNMMSSDGEVNSSVNQVLSYGNYWVIDEIQFENKIMPYREFDFEGDHYVFDYWEDEDGNAVIGNQRIEWASEDYTVNYYAVYDIFPIEEDEPIDDFEFHIMADDDEEAQFEISDSAIIASLLIPDTDEFEDAVVTVTITKNGRPFATVVSSDIENPQYVEGREAYEYPIALDLTQISDKDLIQITLDCFDEDVWEYAVEIDGDTAFFHFYEEILEFYVFYGNITTADLNNPYMMGPRPNGNFIEVSIPDAYNIYEGSIVVTDGETEIINQSFDDSYAGYSYHVLGNEYAVSLDDFDLMSLPENTTLAITLCYGDESSTFKRVRMGDYMYKIVTPDDIAGLYDVSITDRELNSLSEDAISIVATGANRQSIYIDVGGGYFNVYVDDVKVEGLGELILYNWIYSGILYDEEALFDMGIYDDIGYEPEEFAQLDADERAEILYGTYMDVFGSDLYLSRLCSFHFGYPELYVAIGDLGIEETGVYNIKITHVPAPYEEEEPEEPEEGEEEYLPDDYVILQETLVTEKNVAVCIGGEKLNPELEISAEDIAYGDEAVIDVSMHDGFSGEIRVFVDGVGYTVTVTNGEGILSVEGLAVGTHTALAFFNGNVWYYESSAGYTFTVSKAEADIQIIAKNIGLGDDLVVTIQGPSDLSRRVTVTVNGEDKLVSLKDGVGTAKFSGLDIGTYAVKASYNGDANYLKSSAKVYVNVKNPRPYIEVSAEDIAYGDDLVIDIQGPSDIARRVNVTVGDQSKLVSLKNGSGSVKFKGVAAGTQTIVVSYNGDANYYKASVNATVKVNKVAATMKVTAKAVSYGDDLVVNIKGPSDLSRRVTVTVNGEDKAVSLKDGVGSVSFSGLAPGSYDVIVSYSGDSNYLKSSANATAKVNKAVPEIQVTADDITYGEALTVAVQLPADVTKRALVTIDNGTEKYVSLTDGAGSVKFTGLEAGTHEVVVSYAGDAYYKKASFTTTIEVKD